MPFADFLPGRRRAANPEAAASTASPPNQNVETIRAEAAEAGLGRYADTLAAECGDLENARDRIRTAAAKRRSAHSLGYGEAFDRFLGNGLTPDQASSAVLEIGAAVGDATQIHSATTPDTGLTGGQARGYDDPQFWGSAVAEALSLRANPSGEISSAARPYVGVSLVDIARECVNRGGVRTASNSPQAFVEAALHSTSDFPTILGNFVNRRLREAYMPAENSLINASREIEAQDFREQYLAGIGSYPELKKVAEHGEYTRGTIDEEGGKLLKPDTFGRIWGITRQAIINNDIGGMDRTASQVAVTAADFVAKEIATLIESNPNFFDGTSIFHADHGNLASTGADITVAALSEARASMRRQKDVNGNVFLRIEPRYIVVAPDRETEAEQVVAQITANAADDVNPFSGRLAVLVDPRLADGAWYLAADPSRTPGLYHAYLSGARGPQTETRVGFDYDGVEIRVSLDFGCGWGDFRPWFKNPGNGS